MATNKVQDGNILYLAVDAGTKSGDPVVVGNYLHGVALTDRDSAGKATVALGGVWKLPVTPSSDGASTGSAVSVGDAIYYDTTPSPNGLNKNSAGVFFGMALEAIPASPVAAKEIDVMVVNIHMIPGAVTKAMLGDGITPSHRIVAAGQITVPASPSPTAELVEAVVGVIGADLVFVTAEELGSPEAGGFVAEAGSGVITITSTGEDFIAGDKISYQVIRATT